MVSHVQSRPVTSWAQPGAVGHCGINVAFKDLSPAPTALAAHLLAGIAFLGSLPGSSSGPRLSRVFPRAAPFGCPFGVLEGSLGAVEGVDHPWAADAIEITHCVSSTHPLFGDEPWDE